MGLPKITDVVATARELLEPLGNRWLHTQAVGARATELANAVGEDDRHLLVIAGWLHDVGYAPECHETGFHAIDGARWLEDQGYPARLCALVAHHSGATFEAAERRLSGKLLRWPNESSAVTDALWTADMTTGPAGERLTYEERLAEIVNRYEAGSIVHRAMTNARPAIEAAIARTERRQATAE